MKKCINCNGSGGWDIAVPADGVDVMWVSDGECMELGYKKCYWCDGKGELDEKRISEMQKLKGKKQ